MSSLASVESKVKLIFTVVVHIAKHVQFKKV